MTDSVAIPVRDKSHRDGVSPLILCSVPQITLRCIQTQQRDGSPEVADSSVEARPSFWGIRGKTQNLQTGEPRICYKP